MPARYAEGTEVAVEKSRAQLETLLKAHGANQFHSGWDETSDVIEFGLKSMQIRFILPRVQKIDHTTDHHGRLRPAHVVQKYVDQADRQRWRALYLVVRAKLEAVGAGISIFEEEFLAFTVTSTNQTVGEILVPRLKAAAGQFRLTETNK